MKIYCETCEGDGVTKNPYFCGKKLKQDDYMICENCHGNGYTEADVVEVEKVRELLENGMIVELSEWLDSLKEGK